MRATDGSGCEQLHAALTALACLDLTTLDTQLDGLCVSELQTLAGVLVPVLTRLGGVQSVVLDELSSRTGGTVPSAPLPDDPAQTPGPSVLLAHWLRDLTCSTGAHAGGQVRTARLLARLPLVRAA